MIINHELILEVLEQAKNPTDQDIDVILDKAYKREHLSYLDIAKLLHATKMDHVKKIYKIAGKIKEEIYGKRVVIFAPLYISNHCVNNCSYCGYKRDNGFPRKKLRQDQIALEAKIMQKMGHKRLALETGEDPVNVPIDFVIDSIKTIYKASDIRRINVNIAATTTKNYKLLKEAEIGTYILFQETYDKKAYEKHHPRSLKGDYNYHLTAFDRAMEAGIDDVGAGILFGLSDYMYEIIALMMHNDHLEKEYGVGFHTVSVPRLKKAEGMSLDEYPDIISDTEFMRAVTVIRLALPFTGIILSTRETKEMREVLLKHGVSQISAGSNTGVGGYKEEDDKKSNNELAETSQFELSDERSVIDVIKGLIDDGYIASYCTACYRSGRTGDRFMRLAKSGQIGKICEPNALMTLMEYIMDFGDEELLEKGKKYVYERAELVDAPKVKELLISNLKRIENGERDLFV